MRLIWKIIIVGGSLLVWGSLLFTAIYWDLIGFDIAFWIASALVLISGAIWIAIFFKNRRPRQIIVDTDVETTKFFKMAVELIMLPPYSSYIEYNDELSQAFYNAGNPPNKIYYLKAKQRDSVDVFNIGINTLNPKLFGVLINATSQQVTEMVNNLASVPSLTQKRISRQYDQYGRITGEIIADVIEESQEAEKESVGGD